MRRSWSEGELGQRDNPERHDDEHRADQGEVKQAQPPHHRLHRPECAIRSRQRELG